MRIEHLQYYIEVMHSGSISAASKKLFISPQGLSNAIATLEKEIGFPLFFRHKKTLIPTPDGLKVYNDAKELLAKYEEFQTFTQDISKAYAEDKKELVLLCTPMIINMLIRANVFKMLPAEYFLSLREAGLLEIITELRNNTAQLGIIILAQDELPMIDKTLLAEFELIELFRDRNGVCMRKGHPYDGSNEVSNNHEYMRVEYNFSYYNFFGTNYPKSAVYTSDVAAHLYCMKHYDAICAATERTFNVVYNNDENIIFKPYEVLIESKFYAIYNKEIENKVVLSLIKKIKEKITEMI